MATETLSPLPVQRFYDNNGNPAVSAKLFTYQAGTSTKLATYTDSTGVTSNTNPIVMDQRGECNLWIPPNVAYKYVFAPSTDTDPPTNPYWTVDQITNSQLLTLYGGVDTGSANAYILNFTASFTSLSDGIIIYWIPSHTNTLLTATLNVNGLGAINILNSDGSAIQYNQIVANQLIGTLYKGGNWIIFSPPTFQGSFTGTLTGCATSPTQTIYYKIVNGLCTLYTKGGTLSAISNSTAMTITGLPQAVLPLSPASTISFSCLVLDNGVNKMAFGDVSNASSSIGFGLMTVSGANIISGNFTAAGTKGINADWTITYPL